MWGLGGASGHPSQTFVQALNSAGVLCADHQ